MKGLAILAVLCSGCLEPADPEPVIYTCAVLYRCVDAKEDEPLSARLSLPCASTLGEANQLATDAMIAAMAEACPGGWMHVRPLCEQYEPLEACDP